MELTGKTALVTGASRGIGAATALELASQGVNLVLAARSVTELNALKKQIVAKGGKAEIAPCDVTRFEDLSQAVDLCLGRYGGFNILINNAGAIDPISHLANSDPEEWVKAADINYKGVYFGLRAALPPMLAQGSGVIINVSSGAATSALEGWSHYCSSKAAALSLTRCADKEYREKGITVIGISPGTVATDMQVSIKESGINPVSQLDPTVHISPATVGRAISWLCTEDARSFAGTDFSLKKDGNIDRFPQ